MKKLIVLSALLSFVAACSAPAEVIEIEKLEEHTPSEPIEVETDEIPAFELEATLLDVSGGTATGTAGAYYDDGYVLIASFENLPPLEEGYFYEGWVVRHEPLSVLSTGEAPLQDGTFVNEFTSEDDLMDHTFYVLTLEPDDGDPAPAAHILEGTLE